MRNLGISVFLRSYCTVCYRLVTEGVRLCVFVSLCIPLLHHISPGPVVFPALLSDPSFSSPAFSADLVTLLKNTVVLHFGRHSAVSVDGVVSMSFGGRRDVNGSAATTAEADWQSLLPTVASCQLSRAAIVQKCKTC